MFKKFAAARIRRQEGATAVEYGLIAGLIAVVIVTVLALVGTDLKSVFNSIATNLSTAAASK